MSESHTIIEKLDGFIRKYYKNQLLKGALLASSLVLVLFLAVVLMEHFGWFGTTVRTLLFWLFVASFASIVGLYVVRPLLKMFRLGRCISYEEAARIVGDHFPEVQDKLLNLLQLQQMGQSSDSELLQASIDQKAAQLSPVPFLNAINLRRNGRYVKYVAIPLVIIVVLLIVAPSFITGPSKRLINHNTYYERPAPFAFILENKVLQATQQEDYAVRLLVEGQAIPDEVFILVDGTRYRMTKRDATHFSYTFRNLQRGHEFQFSAAGILSAPYQLEVMPKPAVIDFQVTVSYPAYTRRQAETLSNVGDLTLPKGSHIEWLFRVQDADTLCFMIDSSARAAMAIERGMARISRRAMTSFAYAFSAQNDKLFSDTIAYAVSIIPDAAPMIAGMQMTDSTLADRYFFRGQIKDDYGFDRLEFIIERSNAQDTAVHERQRFPIAITSEPSQEFLYNTDFSQIAPAPGDRITYYFEVCDNDAIDGPKATRSQSFEIQTPTEEQIEQILRQGTSDIEHSADLSLSELKKIQEEINEMMRKLVDKKELNWQDKKQLEELKKKQEEVKNQLQQMRQQMMEQQRMEEKYRDRSEQIMEKQKELERLFDEVMNDEIKEMMKEMERLMNEMDKKKVQEELENMKLKNEDLEKQLDQNIELMKRLDLEKRVEEAVNQADELAKEQRELSNSTKDNADKLKEQERLSERFQQLKSDIDQIQKDYKNLDEPSEFKVNEELEKQIEQKQQEAENKLQKNKGKDASKSQKEAADNLEQLSEQLAEAQMEMEQEELAEDAEQIRRLLKNLVRLSFNQEQLITDLNAVSIQDPKYQNIILEQSVLSDDFKNVDDSLRALARRQMAVASVVNKELSGVNSNISKSLSALLQYNQSIYGNYRNTNAAKSMQYSMTSLNNLALVLAEALDQMQNQMRQNNQQRKQGSCKRQGMKMKSNSSCTNPGKGKPSPKSMKSMQDALNKQMEALKKELEKNGNKPGGRTKIGQQNSMSSEFARMAAQQEQIRRMMQEYGQQMKEENAGNSKLAREIDEMMRQMEQTETELVNRTITRQTLQRQQQIMTRLLEHEKAELQREKEERRQSTEGKDTYQPSQGDMEQYQRLKERNMELFRSTPPSLNDYYKHKVDDYFFKF